METLCRTFESTYRNTITTGTSRNSRTAGILTKKKFDIEILHVDKNQRVSSVDYDLVYSEKNISDLGKRDITLTKLYIIVQTEIIKSRLLLLELDKRRKVVATVG